MRDNEHGAPAVKPFPEFRIPSGEFRAVPVARCLLSSLCFFTFYFLLSTGAAPPQQPAVEFLLFPFSSEDTAQGGVVANLLTKALLSAVGEVPGVRFRYYNPQSSQIKRAIGEQRIAAAAAEGPWNTEEALAIVRLLGAEAAVLPLATDIRLSATAAEGPGEITGSLSLIGAFTGKVATQVINVKPTARELRSQQEESEPEAVARLFAQSLLKALPALWEQVRPEPSAISRSARAQRLLAEGLAAYERGDYLLALQQLTDAQILLPAAPEIYVGLAKVEMANKNYERAIAHLRVAVNLAPEDREIHQLLGDCYTQLGQLHIAATHYQLAAGEADRKAQHLELAKSYVEAGRLAEAITELERLVREDPTQLQAWLLLADLLAQRGQRSDAESAYSRAAELAPDNADVQERLLAFHLKYRRYEQALANLFRIAELKPDSGLTLALVPYARGAELIDRQGERMLDESDRLMAELARGRLSRSECVTQMGQLAEQAAKLAEIADRLEPTAALLESHLHRTFGHSLIAQSLSFRLVYLDTDEAQSYQQSVFLSDSARDELKAARSLIPAPG